VPSNKYTTVCVDRETKELLLKVKNMLGHSSYNQLLKHVCREILEKVAGGGGGDG